MTGQELRDFRKSKGWAQGQLVELLGVRQSTISQWENGKRKISKMAEKAIARLIRKDG